MNFIKQLLYISILTTLFFNFLNGQCPDRIYLNSQEDIDNFSLDYTDCVTQGWVTYISISGSDITDLSGLNSIAAVTEELIFRNTGLTSLNSWSNLGEAVDINFHNNTNLVDIDLISNFTSINTLQLRDSPISNFSAFNNINTINRLFLHDTQITDLSAFNSITEFDQLSIINNYNLTTISGFQSLEKISNFNLQGSESLNNVSGLSQCIEIRSLNLDNSGLQNFSDLSSLQAITAQLYLRNNSLLDDLSHLSDLKYIGNIFIQGNPLLNDCCFVQNLKNNNKSFGTIDINNNDIGCNSYFDVLNACPDTDNDGILDSSDNCINSSNLLQTDTDNDGLGDGCDNCPSVSNADQADANMNGIGDVCDNGNGPAIGIYNELGDLYNSVDGAGLILKSTNGDCYRIRVNNQGQLETYPTICP